VVALNRLAEVEFKLVRVRQMMREAGLAAALFKTQANFAWLTAGGNNAVGIATELGAMSILVTAEDRYVITNAIEARRAMEEEGLGELGFKLLSFDWFESRELELAREVAGGGDIGCDVPMPGLANIAGAAARLRYELTEAEIERYVFLGERASRAIEEVAANVKPGDTEAEVVGRLLAELWKDRIDATGYLAAADDRARLYRHPVPTMRKVERCLLLSVNARFKGLIVSVTRMVHLGRPPEELMKQYRDNLLIEATMIAGTRPGRPMRDVLADAVSLYAKLGYGDEWSRHHQGGPTGYAAREIRVTASTPDAVGTNQAFAWNPTISGTKAEDTFVAGAAGPLMVTHPVTFPVVRLEAGGLELDLPGMLIL